MKHVIVHVGPHKTGSTAIQRCLANHTATLSSAGIKFCHDEQTHSIALDLAREQYDAAESKIKLVAKQISSIREEVIILSQEDFSGELIGRSNRKQIYPKLTKNLRVLRRGLGAHQVTFVFFVRSEAEWLRSCYVQNLKYRTKFYTFMQFENFFGDEFYWEQKLEKPKETFPENFVVVEYSKTPSTGIASLLGIAGMSEKGIKSIKPSEDINKSPSSVVIQNLEHINRVSEFQQTAWFTKRIVMKGWSPVVGLSGASSIPSWPPISRNAEHTALPSLGKRVSSRVHRSQVVDIMPSLDVNLRELAFDLLPKEVEPPNTSRERMEDQDEILKYHLRGKSRLAHLNAVVISYLRRETSHTGKARLLFHRIWEEQGVILVNELSTRWLISTLQTFLDHGKNESQRQIGTTGYFYANLLKIYEGERSIEGLEQSSHATSNIPQTKNEFRGLDRYNVGGTDLMLNTNAMALEIALKDDIAGLVLQEFLLRVKSSQNVFTRLDKARESLGIEVPGFTDTWCFFEPRR